MKRVRESLRLVLNEPQNLGTTVSAGFTLLSCYHTSVSLTERLFGNVLKGLEIFKNFVCGIQRIFFLCANILMTFDLL